MIASEKVREVRKAAQLARLAKKGDDDYPAFYAGMPAQVAAAKVNDQIRLDRVEVSTTLEALQIAEITGEGLLAAQEKHEVAKLVLQKREAAQQSTGHISLTTKGA